MIALTAGELAGLRADIESTFTELAEVQRKTDVSNGRGGHTATWSIQEVVPCRRPLPQNLRAPSSEGVLAGQMQSVIEWIIAVPAGTDVRAADRIVIGTRTFEVNNVIESSTEIARYVVATEFAGGGAVS